MGKQKHSALLVSSPLEEAIDAMEGLLGDLAAMAQLNVAVICDGQMSNAAERGFVNVTSEYANSAIFAAMDINRRADLAADGLTAIFEALAGVRGRLREESAVEAAS